MRILRTSHPASVGNAAHLLRGNISPFRQPLFTQTKSFSPLGTCAADGPIFRGGKS